MRPGSARPSARSGGSQEPTHADRRAAYAREPPPEPQAGPGRPCRRSPSIREVSACIGVDWPSVLDAIWRRSTARNSSTLATRNRRPARMKKSQSPMYLRRLVEAAEALRHRRSPEDRRLRQRPHVGEALEAEGRHDPDVLATRDVVDVDRVAVDDVDLGVLLEVGDRDLERPREVQVVAVQVGVDRALRLRQPLVDRRVHPGVGPDVHASGRRLDGVAGSPACRPWSRRRRRCARSRRRRLSADRPDRGLDKSPLV